MDGRTARKLLGVGLCLAALAAAAWLGRRAGLSRPRSNQDFRSLWRQAARPGVARIRPSALWSPVVIQQIGLADPRGPVKSDGAAADWIELYNRSAEPVPLRGFMLTDTAARPAKWRLPDVVLPPGDTLLIWADGLSGVSSYWGAKNPVAGTKEHWDIHPEAGAPAGYVFDATASTGAVPRMTHRIYAPETGLYDVWLIHKPAEACLVEVQVDRVAGASLPERPARHFLATRAREPGGAGGAWLLKQGNHRLDVVLKGGATSVDRLVLTRADRAFGGGEQDLHAGFKLKRTGETISLHSPHGVPLDYVTFPALEPGQAFVRDPAGSGSFRVAPPRPGGLALLNPPTLSLPSGIVASGAVVRIAADPGVTVRYAIDGNVPTENSPLAGEALVVTGSQAVTVRSFRDGAHPSAAVTRFYYVGAPPDIPLLWCTLRPADFTHTVNGILPNPHARGPAGERRAHACLIFPDGTAQSADVGMRPQGRSTRIAKVKKSFRLSCRARYGRPAWPGRVFGAEDESPHTAFVLAGRSLIKHALGLDILRATGLISPRFRHVLFQVNKTPMGVYLLLEDPQDPAFLRHAFGHLDLDVIKEKTANPLKLGSDEMFRKTWQTLWRDPDRVPTLAEFARLMDPAAFMRWAASVHFLGLTDNRQGYFVRDRRLDGAAWTFMAWDLDDAFGFRMDDSGGLPPIYGLRGDVLNGLMKDPAGRRLYVEAAQTLLNHVLKPDPWLARADVYTDALLRHVADEHRGHQAQATRMAKYMTPAQMAGLFEQARRDVAEFLRTQPGAFWNALRGVEKDLPLHRVTVRGEGVGRLRIDGWLEEGPYEGRYFEGTPLRIELASGGPMILQGAGAETPTAKYEAEVKGPLDIAVRAP